MEDNSNTINCKTETTCRFAWIGGRFCSITAISPGNEHSSAGTLTFHTPAARSAGKHRSGGRTTVVVLLQELQRMQCSWVSRTSQHSSPTAAIFRKPRPDPGLIQLSSSEPTGAHFLAPHFRALVRNHLVSSSLMELKWKICETIRHGKRTGGINTGRNGLRG